MKNSTAIVTGVALSIVGICIGVQHYRPIISKLVNPPPSVKVIAVNYQRSEYTAITKDPSVGMIRFTAHCNLMESCPTLGEHKAEEGLYQSANIISQAEEQ